MKNLNVMAPINTLGYGVAAKNSIINLSENFNISLFPIGNPSFVSQQEEAQFAPYINNNFMFDSGAPCLKIWHEFDMAQRVGHSDLIAYSFFELNRMNPAKVRHLSQCKKVVVASEWAKDVVQREVSHQSVHVAPLGVDTSIFYPTRQNKQDKFIVFNCGKWEIRKGHDLILDIFTSAFPDNVDVELWMMCDNPVAPPEYNLNWTNYYKQDIRVRLLPRVQTHQELSNIYNSVSCGLFPSRAEGWNLELLEMMACGKPIVTTDYSSHTEFCTDENSIKIKPKKLEKAFDNLYFKKEDIGDWASLDGITDDFIGALRSLYEQWKSLGEEELLVNHEGIKTAEKFSWKNTASKLQEIIDA